MRNKMKYIKMFYDECKKNMHKNETFLRLFYDSYKKRIIFRSSLRGDICEEHSPFKLILKIVWSKWPNIII